jgi:hypothetical protein
MHQDHRPNLHPQHQTPHQHLVMNPRKRLGRTHSLKRALIRVRDHQLILLVDLLLGEARRRADLPVLRIVSPEDGAQPEAGGDGADAVVNVAEGGLQNR